MKTVKNNSAPRKSTVSMWVRAETGKSSKRTEVVFELVTLSKQQLSSTVRVSKYNPREQRFLSIESLASLRADIRDKGGIIEPAWAYSKDGYLELMDGSRRWRCAVMDDHELKIWVTKSALTPQQIKSITGSFSEQKELSLIERGAMYQQWLDDGLFNDKQSIAAAELKSATIITRALQAHNLRDCLKNCYKDPTSFGASLIAKLHQISEVMKTSDDIAAVVDFERELVNEIDPEMIEHEMTTALKNKKLKKGQPNALTPVALNKAITAQIVELYEESGLTGTKSDENDKVREQRQGRLRMTHDTQDKSLSIAFDHMHPNRQRFALDVNAAILKSTVDVKSQSFSTLDARADEIRKVIEAADEQFGELDSVERKKIAKLFSEVISARHSTIKEEGEKVTDIEEAAKQRAVNSD